MSSYYPRFKYLGINSQDKNLIVSNLDGGDSGEADTFLGMDPIYTDNASGTQRIDYGAKFNNVAVIKITTIRQDGGDFSVENTRDCLKWLTGSRTTSPLDLIDYTTEEFEEDNEKRVVKEDGKIECHIENQVEDVFHVYIDSTELPSDKWTFNKENKIVTIDAELSDDDSIIINYSKVMFTFVGRVTSAWHYKLDARTIGITFEFTSISPWAYSPVKTITRELTGETINIPIPNESDDIDSPIYVKTTFTNTNRGGSLVLTNTLTHEETKISGLVANETVIMDSNQIITSKDNPTRIFGNNFNFVFPCLRRSNRAIKIEDNVFSATGVGDITFEYTVPVKAGDCVIDAMSITNPICDEITGNIQIDTLDWSRISGTPTTLSGYGITEAVEDKIDEKLFSLKADIQETTNNSIANFTSFFEGAVNDLNADIDKVVYDLKSEHSQIEDKMYEIEADLRDETKGSIANFTSFFNGKVNDLENSVDSKITEFTNDVNRKKKELDRSVDDLSKSVDQRIGSLNNHLETKIENLKKEKDKDLESIKTEISTQTNKTLSTTKTEIYEKLDNQMSEFKTDVKKQINNGMTDIKDNTYTREQIDSRFENLVLPGDNAEVTTLSWYKIMDKPDTISGYGITNVYTKTETEELISAVKIEIDEAELTAMLLDVLQ